MATVGHGRALTGREHSTQRNRRHEMVTLRRERNHKADWDVGDSERVPCVDCDGIEDAGSMFRSGHGFVCANCFLAGEGLAVRAPIPSGLQLFARPMSWLLIPLVPAVFLVWAGPGSSLLRLVAGGAVRTHYAIHAVVLLWLGSFFLANFGSPWMVMNLLDLRRQDSRRQDITPKERTRLLRGHLWHGVMFFGCLSWSWFITTMVW